MPHTPTNHEVIVIGGGSLGLAAAYELGKKGVDTLVLEHFTFLNDKGSSAGVSRQFRVPYPDKYMVQMAMDAREYWAELQEHSPEEPLMAKVGTLWFGDPEVTSTEGNIKAAKEAMGKLKVPYTALDKADIERDYHFTNLPDEYEGLFQGYGASINLRQTLKTLYKLNQESPSVTLVENAPVLDLKQEEDLFYVTAGNQTFVSKKIVVVPGPYINDILAFFNFQVPVTYWQMSSCYFKKKNPEINYPTWFAFQQPAGCSGNEFYGFPSVAWDHPDFVRVAPDFVMKPLSSPHDADFIPNQEELDYTSEWVRDHMPDLYHTPMFTSTCLMALSNAPNKEFLLDFAPDFVPNNQNIIICATGWVAKFIPMLGQILANMATEGEPNYDISPFKIDAFNRTYNGEVSNEYDRDEVRHRLNAGMADEMKIDTAIIGAGMSGLYSAFRLTETHKLSGDQVQIFDLSERICGRIESIKMPEMDVVGELGGMRYLTSQKIITTLIEQVFNKNLTPVPFPMGDPQYLFAYLRKQRVKQDAWEEKQALGEKLITNYQLTPETVGFNADQLFNKVFYDVLMADPWFQDYNWNIYDKDGKQIKQRCEPLVSFDGEYSYTFKLTSENWSDVKEQLTYCFPGSPYDRRKVYELGFWNLIKDRVSQEGYNFLADAGGYYSNTINWNAAEAFPYMIGDFSANTEYKTIASGFDSIGYELAKAYLDHEGSNIWIKNKLLTFSKTELEQADNHRYKLTFLNLDTKKKWHVYANKIILAMPRRSLELLDQQNFFFNINTHRELNHNIRSVIKEPAYKILMGFETAWWKSLGIDSGHSITDLPMRQCYYFGTDPTNGHSMLLGSYGDMSTETFWKALSDDPQLFKAKYNRAAYKAKYDQNDRISEEMENFDQVQASQLMVNEVVNELREVHGANVAIPEPYVTWFRDWTDDPFGAGYHAWKAGFKVYEVMPYMRKPLPNENIHICGEAYSGLQGWIEGAFCEAEKMLEKHFDLEYPSWLEPDYYMGW